MLMEKIAAGLPQAIADALEDAGPTIGLIREVTARLARGTPGTRNYRADEGELRRLMDLVESRAGRIEPEPLTADGLLAYANAADRAVRRIRPGTSADASRALHDEYQSTLAREAAAIRALTAAQIARDAARRDREAAEEAYNAHGASRLVR